MSTLEASHWQVAIKKMRDEIHTYTIGEIIGWRVSITYESDRWFYFTTGNGSHGRCLKGATE